MTFCASPLRNGPPVPEGTPRRTSLQRQDGEWGEDALLSHLHTVTQPPLFKQHRKPRLRHPPPRLRRKPENGPGLLRRRLQDEIHPDARVQYVADLYHGPATTVIINIVGVFAFGYVQAPDRVCETLRYPNDRHTLGVSDEQTDQDVNVRDP
ncbi:hypothetical protein CCUS01_14964 [Colletotrichum cuscutae]|uniref:Uncharacterized protein n=1 Tax=Colletotrichum cuscutae TaxID=1209917 RepID=A0AAI9VFH0_9PEZI|nr:hypothetical protein CCUS01_14964 [Colletotrichum cuscutae]